MMGDILNHVLEMKRLKVREKELDVNEALEKAACVAESPPYLETDVAEAIRALKEMQ